MVDDGTSKGLHFPLDGTVDQRLIARHYQEEVKSRGVVLLPTKVTSISQESSENHPAGHNFCVTTNFGNLSTKKLIIATGIWTTRLMESLGVDLPIISVLHPYAYGPVRFPRSLKQPFVRWPERHIYARDHGTFDGWGCYDHEPIRCVPDDSALFSPLSEDQAPRYILPKQILFIAETSSITIGAAVSVFPDSEKSDSKNPHQVFQAAFSVTPDSLPLAGVVPEIPGLYVAAAIWITHAAGVARLVADIVEGTELPEPDIEVVKAFDPMRFEGQDQDALKERALATYNDIYNKHTQL